MRLRTRRSPTPLGMRMSSGAHQIGPEAGVNAPLTVEVSTADDRAAVVSAAGEVDATTVELLRPEIMRLADDGRIQVVLDLSDVTFLDSSGLGALVSGHRRLQLLGGRLGLVCRNDLVLRVFRLTGLDKVMLIVPTLEQALDEADQSAAGASASASERRAPGTTE